MVNFSEMGPMGQLLGALPVYLAVIGGMYFFLLRPQQKKRKEEEELRKNLQIGDEITTIGGIIGKVISIKEDTNSVVIESGTDKLRIEKWAIARCNIVKETAREAK